LEQRAKKCGEEPACPLCHVKFAQSLPVPQPFEDPEAWYSALDFSGCGNVSRSDILGALHATLHVRSRWLDQIVCNQENLGDTVSLKECQALLKRIERDQGSAQAKAHDKKIPDHIQHKHAWFDYWDTDGAGLLTQEEVTRALLKTLHSKDALSVHDAIAKAWKEVDQFDSGLVDSERVLHPGTGLLDRVIQHMSTDEITVASRSKSKLRKAVKAVMSANHHKADIDVLLPVCKF
jgi:hypothetical protein